MVVDSERLWRWISCWEKLTSCVTPPRYFAASEIWNRTPVPATEFFHSLTFIVVRMPIHGLRDWLLCACFRVTNFWVFELCVDRKCPRLCLSCYQSISSLHKLLGAAYPRPLLLLSLSNLVLCWAYPYQIGRWLENRSHNSRHGEIEKVM